MTSSKYLAFHRSNSLTLTLETACNCVEKKALKLGHHMIFYEKEKIRKILSGGEGDRARALGSDLVVGLGFR